MRVESPKSKTRDKRRPRGRPPSPESRERILDAALRLFSEKGFSDASVGEVQAAAGLSSGSGALYKHFASKEELLEAGIERELVHLDAIRRARKLVPDVGDLRGELEILGRFLLLELSAERDLLRILLKDADRFPRVLVQARERLIDPAYAEFADWLRLRSDRPVPDIDATAAVAFGAIVQYRAIEALLGRPPAEMDEERFLQAWVEMVWSIVGGS